MVLRVTFDHEIDEWLYLTLMLFGNTLTVVEPARLRSDLIRRHSRALENLRAQDNP